MPLSPLSRPCHFFLLFSISLSLFAQRAPRQSEMSALHSTPVGLSAAIIAGAYFPNKSAADYYNGAPTNRNNISLVLQSPYYKPQIESAFGVFNDSTFRLDSWSADMFFRPTYAVGLGLHYFYNNHFGWVIKTYYARLETQGLMTFSTQKNHLNLEKNQYQANILGEESRIHFDIGIAKAIDIAGRLGGFVEGGVSMSNARILQNKFIVGSLNIDLINRYNNRPYLPELTPYKEEQTFLGFGGWVAGGLAYGFNTHTAIQVGVRTAMMKTNHENHSKWGMDYHIYLNFILSNLFAWS